MLERIGVRRSEATYRLVHGEAFLNRRSTIGHELNHACLGHFYDRPIAYVSFVPDGSSLGKIVFMGHIPIAEFQTIAAGGAVATPYGRRGYSQDLIDVHRLSLHPDGIAPAFAFQTAEDVLSQRYPMPKRERMITIIESLQLSVIPGGVIEDIIDRVQKETIDEKISTLFPFVEIKPVDMTHGEYSEIILLPDNLYRLIYLVDGKRIREDSMCGHCRGFNGHAKECPIHLTEDLFEI